MRPQDLFAVASYGIVAVATSRLVLYPFLFSILFYFVRREIGIGVGNFIAIILPAFRGSIFMAIGVAFVRFLLPASFQGTPKFAFLVAIGVILFAAYYRIFEPRIISEVQSLGSLAFRKNSARDIEQSITDPIGKQQELAAARDCNKTS